MAHSQGKKCAGHEAGYKAWPSAPAMWTHSRTFDRKNCSIHCTTSQGRLTGWTGSPPTGRCWCQRDSSPSSPPRWPTGKVNRSSFTDLTMKLHTDSKWHGYVCANNKIRCWENWQDLQDGETAQKTAHRRARNRRGSPCLCLAFSHPSPSRHVWCYSTDNRASLYEQ